MGIIDEHLAGYISVRLKNREDDYTDQMSRIIVTKLFIVTSVLVGIAWFQDETHCIPPSYHASETPMPYEFIRRGCWVQGFYVYPHMANHMQHSAYYGIPVDMSHDGHLSTDPSTFCNTEPRIKGAKIIKPSNSCVPMAKEFYTQYQWMPFYFVTLAFLFHYPYLIFRLSNTDMASLQYNLKNNKVREIVL